MAIETIDPDAGEGGDDEDGDLADEADDTEDHGGALGHCFAAEAVDEPGRGDDREPGADEREDLAGEEETVIAMTKRPTDEPYFPVHGDNYRRWGGS